MVWHLRSVNAGRVRVIGERAGAPLLSAFGKTAVPGAHVAVGRCGLAGDEQANLLVHGGPDKAVYAYPSAHWPWWEARDVRCHPGSFGENLTLEGPDETDVHVGDRLAWGEVVLEVSQPRSPCRKLQIMSAREDASALMVRSGHCGWYFRVLQTGMAPTGGRLVRIAAGAGGSVRELFLAGYDGALEAEKRRRLSTAPALADAWRVRLAR